MELIVATHNRGKLKEFQRILAPLGYQVVSQQEAGIELEVEETGTTFEENARLKACAIAHASGKAAVADDSGLCVDALDGAPGVYSARYAPGSDDDRIVKLLAALEGVPDSKRQARFVSAVCACFPGRDGQDELVEALGVCEGSIGYEKRGDGGFGYDPVFLVGGRSFSELSGEEKDALSHRGRALRQLAQLLSERDG